MRRSMQCGARGGCIGSQVMQAFQEEAKAHATQLARIGMEQDSASTRSNGSAASRPSSPGPDFEDGHDGATSATSEGIPRTLNSRLRAPAEGTAPRPSRASSGYVDSEESGSSEHRRGRAEERFRSHSRCQSPEDFYFKIHPDVFRAPLLYPLAASTVDHVALNCMMTVEGLASQPAVGIVPPHVAQALASHGMPAVAVEPQVRQDGDAEASCTKAKQRAELPARWSRGRRGGTKAQLQHSQVANARARASLGTVIME
mmetsp:Transcript_25740/g.83168  ORF Transcript_25740/g.83168 Transcript_25740/m.83168 type:complete len:258 (-) Transcript_25740:253-1026(-)